MGGREGGKDWIEKNSSPLLKVCACAAAWLSAKEEEAI